MPRAGPSAISPCTRPSRMNSSRHRAGSISPVAHAAAGIHRRGRTGCPAPRRAPRRWPSTSGARRQLALEQVAAHFLQPLGLDAGQAAAEQPRGIHQLGHHDPLAGLLGDGGARMRPELDAAGAQVAARRRAGGVLDLAAHVAQQAGEQRLVDVPRKLAGLSFSFQPCSAHRVWSWVNTSRHSRRRSHDRKLCLAPGLLLAGCSRGAAPPPRPSRGSSTTGTRISAPAPARGSGRGPGRRRPGARAGARARPGWRAPRRSPAPRRGCRDPARRGSSGRSSGPAAAWRARGRWG